MSKYRKKPVVIDAELFDRDKKHRLSDAFRAAICNCADGQPRPAFNVASQTLRADWHIHTLEGVHQISDGDWIIRGIKGEFYPCKPDVFEATYERV